MPKNVFQSRQKKVFARILAVYLRSTQNNHQIAKNSTDIPVKPVSRLKNERFRPYRGNDAFDRLKKSSKVL